MADNRRNGKKKILYLRTYFPGMGESSKKIQLYRGILKSPEECGQK